MAIPTSKPLSLSTVQTEYGGSNPINMSEYRGDGNAPASGAIDLWGDFNGTSNSASIEIRVYGAAGGGGATGGYSNFQATVSLGTVFALYAGGKGDASANTSYGLAGGGAASFVTINNASGTLIAVAGGGSGGGNGSSSNRGSGSGGDGLGIDIPPVTYRWIYPQGGQDWSAGGAGGRGGMDFNTGGGALGGANPGGKGAGGRAGWAESVSDQGGGGGGGGYGGGCGGGIDNDYGSGGPGIGGKGYVRTGNTTGITVTSATGTTGVNSGHGYIEVYKNGQLVKTVTATSRTGASGTYTV